MHVRLISLRRRLNRLEKQNDLLRISLINDMQKVMLYTDIRMEGLDK